MYNVLSKSGNIPQYLLESCESFNEWNTSFKCNMDRTLHFELPNMENLSLTIDKLNCFGYSNI